MPTLPGVLGPILPVLYEYMYKSCMRRLYNIPGPSLHRGLSRLRLAHRKSQYDVIFNKPEKHFYLMSFSNDFRKDINIFNTKISYLYLVSMLMFIDSRQVFDTVRLFQSPL